MDTNYIDELYMLSWQPLSKNFHIEKLGLGLAENLQVLLHGKKEPFFTVCIKKTQSECEDFMKNVHKEAVLLRAQTNGKFEIDRGILKPIR